MKAIALILLFATSAGAFEVPELTSRITDNASIFTQEQKQRLETKLADYEKGSSDQIVILTVKSLEGMPIETYSMKVVSKWKIGTKKYDNGVLVLYSPSDHKMRIEVGRGLEGKLNDGLAGEIIREKFSPFTKAGKYYEGFDAGTTAIISAVKGEYKSESASAGAVWRGIFYIVLLLVSAIIAIAINAGVHPLAGGAAGAIGGFILTLIFVGLGWAFLAALIGFLVGLIAKEVVESGSSSSGSSFSSSGSGGYSGGGGSFDGGGASGDA